VSGTGANLVRDLLVRTWGDQSCTVRRADWEDHVFDALVKDGRSVDGAPDGAGACTTGIPNNVDQVVYLNFPLLDAAHRALFVQRLREAAAT
jgi:hypothetical protein